MQQPEALYIHIPFCVRKCPYCDFYSVDDRQHRIRAYAEAVVAELRHARAEVGAARLRSLYIGGGTPTLLALELLLKIVDASCECFDAHRGVEVTCECNPGTVDLERLTRLRAAGVNRLSIGVQSFDDEELRFLGRVHSAAEGRQAVLDAREAGFDNLSLDLLYCLPGQTREQWEANLTTALELGPAHVSAYCLQVEPATPLATRVAAGEVAVMPDDEQADLYSRTVQVLEAGGLKQYEVSNHAVRGAECRHNLTYWRNEPYIGVGASAWSYLEGERRQNVADLETYATAWLSGEPCVAYRERCSGTAAANETLMMGLRTAEGLSLADFRARHGVDLQAMRGAEIDRLCREGLVSLRNGRLMLCAAGMAVAGEITAILALSEKE